MTTLVAVARQTSNRILTATAHRRLAIVAIDTGDQDAPRVLLRDPVFLGNLPQARKHARTIAPALAERHACPVDAQVLDVDTGDLLFSVTAGGAS